MSTVALQTASTGSMMPHVDAGLHHNETSMLLEVVFKWLMAGHGWWIDPTRLHRDASYASQCLKSAMATNCAALCTCAAKLQARINTVGHMA